MTVSLGVNYVVTVGKGSVKHMREVVLLDPADNGLADTGVEEY